LHFGINELRVNKRYESEKIVNKDCAFCPGILEDETHFLFHCPLYSSIRHKHIAEFMAQEALLTLMVGSHDRRSLQLSKSCISLQLFEITNGRQKDEFNQA